MLGSHHASLRRHLMGGLLLRGDRAAALPQMRARWTAATFKAPPPPPPPPRPEEKLVMLFPRLGSHQTSIEVKRRVLRSTPHMGGTRLKRMVREHARKGNMNSFIADFESRIDRFLYRCNAVPSIFAARMVCGHRHVLLNGKICTSTHTLLKPGDIVEPTQRALPLFKQLMHRRLANNNFVLRKDRAPSTAKILKGPVPPAISVDRTALFRDGAAIGASYRRLPPPRDSTAAAAAPSDGDSLSSSSVAEGGEDDESASAQIWPAARQKQLDTIMLSVLGALAGEDSALASETTRHRYELSVRAAAQQRGQPAPSATLGWRAEGSAASDARLLTIDRIAMRRTLLALLALRPGKQSN